MCPRLAEVTPLTGDVPVHVVSPKLGEGLDRVAGHLPAGKTGALLGSSGVGKSTIINRLVGRDVQKTRDIREADSKEGTRRRTVSSSSCRTAAS